ncbi:MAG TPA: hypothetical protein VFP26_13415 [Gemmatimonadaceae bacterium]|nr:hypothetical protein [Gemmatimonadaceae bacterium]
MRPCLLVAVLCLAGSACRNNTGPIDHLVVLDVDKVEAPATISSTSPLDVVLTVLTNPCQSFERIEADRLSSSAKLTAIGHDPEKGCTNLGVLQPKSYRLEPPFVPGTFTITVDRGRVSPLVATIQVR